MAGKVKTYNPKEVVIACGSHIVTGIADDSFVTIEANGDGITKKVGCDGEIGRAVSPDNTYKVKISLLQMSDSNAYFSRMVDLDRETGNGMFPVLIKDLKGGQVFSSISASCDGNILSREKRCVTQGTVADAAADQRIFSGKRKLPWHCAPSIDHSPCGKQSVFGRDEKGRIRHMPNLHSTAQTHFTPGDFCLCAKPLRKRRAG